MTAEPERAPLPLPRVGLGRLGFRWRLFVILLCFALIPSALLLLVWEGTSRVILPMIGTTAAWDSVAASGHRALAAAKSAPLSAAARAALSAHDSVLDQNVKHAQQTSLLVRDAGRAVAGAAIILLALLAFIALRVAGHLSRNLSRPLSELVGWTSLIERGQPLPDDPPRRGAPEFAVLRERMHGMSNELRLGQARALEAERGEALRETARQVAHEIKNPLTPIRFAVDRLRREAPASLAETVDVLATETDRLEAMARSFAQFGRLPEGPTAQIDVAELLRYVARSTIPEAMLGDVEADDRLPLVNGHYDALLRAVSNIVLNAVDACHACPTARVDVRASLTHLDKRAAVDIAVHDNGRGIPADKLPRIWEPYVTTKPGGTGLGLAIVRQTAAAHGGSVRAESAAGHGTTIHLVLPADS